MKIKNQIMLAGIAYILFMIVFTSVFLPSFTEKVGDNEMVDAYLVDYRKSISDIETLILNYGEEGRIYMVPFLSWTQFM